MNKSLNDSIIEIRVKLQNAGLKKTGKNKSAGFDYFELSDFLPKLNELMLEEKINDLFTIEDEKAVLTLIKGEERQEYKMPFVIFETPIYKKTDYETGEVKEIKSMQDIQYLGALNTYYKRYLYLNAFGITDGEIIDSMNNDEVSAKKTVAKNKEVAKATQRQIDLIEVLVSDIPKMLEHYKIEKIEDLTTTQASEIITKKKGVK